MCLYWNILKKNGVSLKLFKMETKKLYSNFSLKITKERIKNFLQELPRVYVFRTKSVKSEWITLTEVTLEYILKWRREIEYIEISLSTKESGTIIILQGEKNLSLEYFKMELEKIL